MVGTAGERPDSRDPNPSPNVISMFSAGPTHFATPEKPETEQLNLRIRAELSQQLERASVVLSARRGVPTHRVAVIEEALTAYFAANNLR